MKTIYLTSVLVVLAASMSFAKRLAPPDVPPIRTEGAIFSVPHFAGGERDQNGGFVEARHPKTKKLLWRVQVYKTTYDKTLEKDVQDVFIRSLSFDQVHGLLILSDERGRMFVLNPKTKKVTKVS